MSVFSTTDIKSQPVKDGLLNVFDILNNKSNMSKKSHR